MAAETRDRLLEWLSIPSIGFPKFSTHRDRLGFFWDPTGKVELYTLRLDGGPPVQVTHGELPKSPNAPFVWSPDDRSLFVSRDKEGNELHDLCRIDLEDGSITPLTNDPTCQRYAISVSPDGRWLVFASDKGRDGAERQLDLWRIPTSGGSAERLSHHRQPVNLGSARQLVSPDGKYLVYGASDQEDPRDAEVFLARTDGSGTERIFSVRPGSWELPATWSPNGRLVAIESDATPFKRSGLLDIDSHDVRWLGAGTADEIPADFSPDGRSLLVFRFQGVRVEPAIYDLKTGGETIVPFGLDQMGEMSFLPDGHRVAAVTVASNRPNHVAVWSPADHGISDVLPPNFGPLTARDAVSSETIQYTSFDGRPIEAILYRPPGGRKSPAVVEVHGGPTWQFFDTFDVFTQYLVSLGLTVLQPNVRGSTGYGSEFRDLNLRDLGGGDLKDVAAAAEYLRQQPYVDPNRIGIWGVSYGGYLTYAALTWYPELWACGVAIAGVTDWKVCYDEELPALQHYDRQLMGDPVKNATLYHDRSPVHFAQNVKAPLFMIHGLNDPRCPVSQARLFRDALIRFGRKEGVDFEYLEFSDEGHGSADREQMLRTYRPAFTFLERHLQATRTRP